MKTWTTSKWRDAPQHTASQREQIVALHNHVAEQQERYRDTHINYVFIPGCQMPSLSVRLRWGQSKTERISAINTHMVGMGNGEPINTIQNAGHYQDTEKMCNKSV